MTHIPSVERKFRWCTLDL